MRKIKLLVLFTLLAVCVCSAVACEMSIGHTYSDEHTYDENNHWFECTGEGCESKRRFETHEYVVLTQLVDGVVCYYDECFCGYRTELRGLPEQADSTVTVNTEDELRAAIENAVVGTIVEIDIGADIHCDIAGAGDGKTFSAKDYAFYIAEGKNIVLDLNGYDLTAESDHREHTAFIYNRGTLTLKDSVGEGGSLISYQYKGTTNLGWECVMTTIYNFGNLYVESVTVKNATEFEGEVFTAIDSSTASHICNPYVEIKGGEVVSTGLYYAIRQFAAPINEGIDASNTCIIKGGKVGCVYISYSDDKYDDITASLTITGGTFEGWGGNDTTAVGTNDLAHVNIDISGGVIDGKVTLSKTVDSDSNTIRFITGGSFRYDVSEFVKEGYTATEEDGFWKVEKVEEAE